MMHLQNEIKRYTKEFEDDTRQLHLLQENPGNMERIARERYLMKKPNEDIFVFEEDLPNAPTVLMEQITVETSSSAHGQKRPEPSFTDSATLVRRNSSIAAPINSDNPN